MTRADSIRHGIQIARIERGVVWGRASRTLADRNADEARKFAETLRPILMKELIAGSGHARPANIARTLNALGIPSPAGRKWHGSTVSRIIKRLPGLTEEVAAERDRTFKNMLKAMSMPKPVQE